MPFLNNYALTAHPPPTYLRVSVSRVSSVAAFCSALLTSSRSCELSSKTFYRWRERRREIFRGAITAQYSTVGAIFRLWRLTGLPNKVASKVRCHYKGDTRECIQRLNIHTFSLALDTFSNSVRSFARSRVACSANKVNVIRVIAGQPGGGGGGGLRGPWNG